MQQSLFSNALNIEMPYADVTLHQAWIDSNASDALMKALLDQVAWSQPSITIAGRATPIPRLQAWYGDKHARYSYSGQMFEPLDWLPCLESLRDRLNDQFKQSFNSVLVNCYRDGQDSVGWHADDEKELGENPTIASLSLGATRRFKFKPKTPRFAHDAVDIFLAHGDLVMMAGETQQYWVHGVPKTKKPVGSRINLTFRQVV